MADNTHKEMFNELINTSKDALNKLGKFDKTTGLKNSHGNLISLLDQIKHAADSSNEFEMRLIHDQLVPKLIAYKNDLLTHNKVEPIESFASIDKIVKEYSRKILDTGAVVANISLSLTKDAYGDKEKRAERNEKVRQSRIKQSSFINQLEIKKNEDIILEQTIEILRTFINNPELNKEVLEQSEVDYIRNIVDKYDSINAKLKEQISGNAPININTQSNLDLLKGLKKEIVNSATKKAEYTLHKVEGHIRRKEESSSNQSMFQRVIAKIIAFFSNSEKKEERMIEGYESIKNSLNKLKDASNEIGRIAEEIEKKPELSLQDDMKATISELNEPKPLPAFEPIKPPNKLF